MYEQPTPPPPSPRGSRTALWAALAAGVAFVAALAAVTVWFDGRLSDSDKRVESLQRQLTASQQVEQAQARQLQTLQRGLSSQVGAINQKLTQQDQALKAAIKAAPPQWRDVASRVGKSVVLVGCEVDHEEVSSGSGFAISIPDLEPGYATAILTNAHVVNECDQVVVHGEDRVLAAALIDAAQSETTDIALLEVRGSFPPLQQGPLPRPGDPVAAIGHPLGGPRSITTGDVANVNADGWINASAPISSGNSGGPLVDGKGRVLGLTTLTLIDPFGINQTQNLNLSEPLISACAVIPGECPFS